jgi:hypothetical protein
VLVEVRVETTTDDELLEEVAALVALVVGEAAAEEEEEGEEAEVLTAAGRLEVVGVTELELEVKGVTADGLEELV